VHQIIVPRVLNLRLGLEEILKTEMSFEAERLDQKNKRNLNIHLIISSAANYQSKCQMSLLFDILK